MDPIQNPFAPGAGTPPPELAGRDNILQNVRTTLERLRHGRSHRSVILVGLRGVGKTVLLNRIREMAEGAGYRSLMLEAHEAKSLPMLLVPPLRRILVGLDSGREFNEKVKRGFRVLKSFAGRFRAKVKVNEAVELELGMDAEKGTADSGDIEQDLSDLLVAVAEAAQERKAAICLLIDELQYIAEQEMSALIIALHQVAQRRLPLVVVGAGLPLILALAGRSKSYAERLFEFPYVGRLEEEAARRALEVPVAAQGVQFSEQAIRKILKITQGYPYFLQQWGYEVWNAAARSPIRPGDVERATGRAIHQLDESFFKVRFDRLTKREKDFLFAMMQAEGEPKRSGDIADQLGVKVTSIGPLRSSLIRKGMIYSPSHGDNAFTVPLFDEFLLRRQEEAGL